MLSGPGCPCPTLGLLPLPIPLPSPPLQARQMMLQMQRDFDGGEGLGGFSDSEGELSIGNSIEDPQSSSGEEVRCLAVGGPLYKRWHFWFLFCQVEACHVAGASWPPGCGSHPCGRDGNAYVDTVRCVSCCLQLLLSLWLLVLPPPLCTPCCAVAHVNLQDDSSEWESGSSDEDDPLFAPEYHGLEEHGEDVIDLVSSDSSGDSSSSGDSGTSHGGSDAPPGSAPGSPGGSSLDESGTSSDGSSQG